MVRKPLIIVVDSKNDENSKIWTKFRTGLDSGPDRTDIIVRSGFSIFRQTGPKKSTLVRSNPDQNLDQGPDQQISDQKSARHTKIRTGFLYISNLFVSILFTVSYLRILFLSQLIVSNPRILFPILFHRFQSNFTVSNLISLYLLPIYFYV